MSTNKSVNVWVWCLSLGIFLNAYALFPKDATAQVNPYPIRPDNTLPINSRVINQGNVNLIEGGTQSGGNLFHSFQYFSVPTNNTAVFNNSINIQNIISRVTGGSISNIDGLIRANGTANLFFINPSGIVFGPNARLGIGGSFVGSTANSLRFADGTFFSATNTQSNPLLTISTPIGLQFGVNPGRIQVQGDGQGIRTTTNLIDTNNALRVQPNQTLALIGGDISLEGATLKTAGGRIELGSVAGEGLVSLTSIDKGFQVGYDGVQNFGNIQLIQQAVVDASGEGGGDVQVMGRRISLTNGSQIEASTLGASPGGNLVVNAQELVEVIGTSNGGFLSGLFAQVYTGAAANGGNLTINTSYLLVRDGAVIDTSTFDAGNGGNLTINAKERVELVGTSPNGQNSSRLSADVNQGATGNAGNLTINTGNLLVRDGAFIGTRTFGAGNGGNLTINAKERVELVGISPNGQNSSALVADVNQGATGNAGNLTINTGNLLVRDGAFIGARTFGRGNAGDINIQVVDRVSLDGVSPDGFSGGVSSSVRPEGIGKGGNVTFEADSLEVTNGAQISTSTFGLGDAGNLNVLTTDSVVLSGTSSDGLSPSGLYSAVELGSVGNGGSLNFTVGGQFVVRDGAQVSTATFGLGNSGNLNIDARNSVELIGTGSRLTSAVVEGGEGNGGSLRLASDRLLIRDGAEITVSNEGRGRAGNLQAFGRVIRLDNQGALRAESTSDSGGNIELRAQDLLLLNNNSLISAISSGSGGAGIISIDSGFLTALRRSNIIAASTPTENVIRVNTQRLVFSGDSAVLVNGEPILEGTSFAPITPEQPMVKLIDTSNLVDQSCRAFAGEEGSKFTFTGRGGLPPSPNDPLTPDALWTDDRMVKIPNQDFKPQKKQQSSQKILPHPQRLAPATGWVFNEKGEVRLISHNHNSTPYDLANPKSGCRF